MSSLEAWQTIEYRIDGQGILTYVSDSWTQFALANGSPDLISERVIGKPLLSFISDPETRHLYQIILERVRARQVPVVVTLRCDAPDVRRFLELIISRSLDQEIQFLSRTLRTEPREFVPLLDPSTNRSSDLLAICGWCKQVRLPGERWVEVEVAVMQLELFCRDALPRLTHGVCPTCCAKIMDEFSAN